MKIDLVWTFPFIGPFILIGLMRLVWMAAGAEWTGSGIAAAGALVFGILIGCLVTALCLAQRWRFIVTVPFGRR